MKIKYIGSKPMVRDTVAGTGVVWDGEGDVQEVPDTAVGALLAHSGVWQRAGVEKAKPIKLEAKVEKPTEEEPDGKKSEGEGEDTNSGDAQGDQFDAMNDGELKSFARSNGLNSRESADGIRADLRKTGDELRESVRAAWLADQAAGEEA